MKKFLSLILGVLMIFSFPIVSEAEKVSGSGFVFVPDKGVIDMTKTKTTKEFQLRDPCVLVYGQKYFMYGTGAANGPGYGCYVSEDLVNWAGPVNVFSAPPGFAGVRDFWAPECHYYNGKFYLFATYYSSVTNHRGVSIFRAESPLGPFEEISDSHVTPKDWDSIDGTLYIDENNQPWMVFVHEWTSIENGIGEMAAARLSSDLTHFISKPIKLFGAKEAPWSSGGITDGPWMYRNKKGELLMLWSNSTVTGYSVGVAKSSDGTVSGKWKQQFMSLYCKDCYNDLDGGHGMIFTALDGKMYLSIHSPNGSTPEHPTEAIFVELEEVNGKLIAKDEYTGRDGFKNLIVNWFYTFIYSVKNFFKNLKYFEFNI